MKHFRTWIGIGALMIMSTTAQAATAKRSDGGTLNDGTKIEAITLSNSHGVSARIISFGATLQSLSAPDKHGKIADVTLGYDKASDYEAKPNYFGVTVGRYANRIARGKFSLDGIEYQTPINNAPNSLHGGNLGFDKKNWTVKSISNGPIASVVLSLISPDGDMGYPGEVTATCTYALDEKGALSIEFDATTTKSTIINMTNHAIFNLAGEGAPQGALGHKLTLAASHFTPVDESLIPTGELRSVKGSVFDFTKGRIVSDGVRDARDEQIRIGRGYDHNFALDKGLTKEPQLAARLEDSVSGRVVEVFTTEPGIQVYTGNFLDGSLVGKGGHLYRMGDGIALEPEKFPDTPNQPAFGSARVDPDKPYHHHMIYRLSVTK